MERNSLTDKYHREDRTKRNLRTKNWHKTNRRKSYLTAARKRAEKTGVPFDIDVDDIVFPPHCPVLGIPIFFSEHRTDHTPSLDKIIPEKGYVRGNVSIISWRANRLKSDATLEELEKIIAYMKGDANVGDNWAETH